MIALTAALFVLTGCAASSQSGFVTAPSAAASGQVQPLVDSTPVVQPMYTYETLNTKLGCDDAIEKAKAPAGMYAWTCTIGQATVFVQMFDTADGAKQFALSQVAALGDEMVGWLDGNAVIFTSRSDGAVVAMLKERVGHPLVGD